MTAALRGIAAVALATWTLLPALAAHAELRPLEEGWERFFSVTWNPGQRRGGAVVTGHLNNESPYTIGNVRILVDSLDANGRIIDQRLAWVPGILGGNDHLYFEVPVGAAAQYRVRLFAYDRIGRPFAAIDSGDRRANRLT